MSHARSGDASPGHSNEPPAVSVVRGVSPDADVALCSPNRPTDLGTLVATVVRVKKPSALFIVAVLLAACGGKELEFWSQSRLRGGYPVAVDGTLTFGISEVNNYDCEIWWLNEFDAQTQGDLAIVDLSPPNVTVKATGPTGGILEILEPGTNLIIGAREVKTGVLHRIVFAGAGIGDDDGGWKLYAAPDGAWITARLLENEGSRLVDESLEWVKKGGGTREKWDGIDIRTLVPGSLLDLEVRTERIVATQTIEVVDEIEAVELAEPAALPTRIDVTEQLELCFRGTHGGLPVAELTWSISSSRAARVSSLYPGQRCVDLIGVEVGTAIITASAGGASTSLSIEIGQP